MVAGRRNVSIHDSASWIFNRMADAYAARPAYPAPLLHAISEHCRPESNRILDLGAGIGHLALPLAEQGFQVTAVEPAEGMLASLSARARAAQLSVRSLHAAAEALPLPDGSVDVALIADALHFMDAELSAQELARVLTARGKLLLVSVEFARTPFMRGIVESMRAAAPRRPRDMSRSVVQLFSVLGAARPERTHFSDEHEVEPEQLEQILRSISFIGPAMNAARFAAFRAQVHAVPGPRLFARRFTLYAATRRGR